MGSSCVAVGFQIQREALSGIFSSVQSLSRVLLFVTPWIAARQASLSITNSRSLPKLISMESVRGKLRPERERLAPGQQAGVQAGSCLSSQDRFLPSLGSSVSGPKVTCVSVSRIWTVHPVSTERSYPAEAHLAAFDPLETSALLHHGPPEVTPSLQFLQPSHPPGSHLEAPPRSLPPSPLWDGTSPLSELSLASSSEGLM